jgi:hypothetical protein
MIKLRGHIELAMFDALAKEVKPVATRSQDNTIVTTGRRWVLQQIASSDIVTSQSISYIAVGTGTNAPATSDTALQSETTRIAISSFITSNLTSNPPSWQAIISLATNQANTTLGEIGLFNSSSGGTMLGRATFSTINKSTSNTLSLTYVVSN